MAVVAPAVVANLAAPNGHEWARIAVGATPGEDVPVGGLHNGEDMSRALVGHFGFLLDETIDVTPGC